MPVASHSHTILGLSRPGCTAGLQVSSRHHWEGRDGHVMFCFLIYRPTECPPSGPPYIFGPNIVLDYKIETAHL